MKQHLALALVFSTPLALAAGCSYDYRPSTGRSSTSQAIVNGSQTTVGAHPWQVAIEDTSGFQFCGGSVIDAGWVLTAQHCMEGESASGVLVAAGITRLSQ